MSDGSVKIEFTADDSDVKKKLDGVESEAKEASGGLDELGDSAKDAGKSLDTVDVAAGNLISNGLTALMGALSNAVGSLVSLADETREFREDMAKLETAFTTAGHTTETSSKAYKDFYAILGESDRSVEAVNHLAELTKSEEEVAKWSTIAAGVTAKFGDSLPIEGLTEAANETAKVGAVTGPLADALNWAGISEEEFNKKLEACTSEQERATLITETLNAKYADAAAEYNELTASTQAARLATAEMEETQAEIGAMIEPLTTAWMNFKAQALEAIIPAIELVVDGFYKISAWMDENPQKAEVVKGVILGIVTALGLLAAALAISTLIQTVKNAFMALNLVMVANPIGIVIAALGGLVAAFLYLWNNCDAFREFWIDLWEKIKKAAADLAEWFKETWVKTVAKVKELVSTWKEFFSGIWTNIQQTFSNVNGWFRDKFQAAKDAITNIWDTVKGYFETVYRNILGVFDTIRKDFFSVGDNIINGIWDGLQAGWDWLKSMVRQLASSLFDAAKSVLGIASPSKKFAWIGEMTAQGQGVGYEAEMDNVEQDMKARIADMTANVQASVSAENARIGQSMGVPDTGFSDLARAVGTQTAGINSLAGEYRRGSNNMRPIILQLDKREVGRAFVDVFNTETTRVGVSMGGA